MKLLEIENEDQQKLALHYVMCLLPKPNLDVLMVLLSFLEEVSYHSGVNQEWGNKMDLDNLATGMFLFLQTSIYKKSWLPIFFYPIPRINPNQERVSLCL